MFTQGDMNGHYNEDCSKSFKIVHGLEEDDL